MSNNLVFDVSIIFELIDDKNTIEKDVKVINRCLYLNLRPFLFLFSLYIKKGWFIFLQLDQFILSRLKTENLNFKRDLESSIVVCA